jgi:hypothetical protein
LYPATCDCYAVNILITFHCLCHVSKTCFSLCSSCICACFCLYTYNFMPVPACTTACGQEQVGSLPGVVPWELLIAAGGRFYVNCSTLLTYPYLCRQPADGIPCVLLPATTNICCL